jgi:hypothetical protein
MSYTCPTELASALPSIPLDSMLSVARHVAWDVLSDIDGVCQLIQHPIRWSAEVCHGDLVVEKIYAGCDELYRVCESAESVFGIDRHGNKITPTFSLI